MNNSVRLSARLLPMLLSITFCPLLAAGQNPNPNPIPMQTTGIGGGAMDLSSHGVGSSVFVSVREPNGLPVTQNATVKLSCPLGNVSASSPTNESALTEFTNVPPGDCFVEVSAPGYRTTRERTIVAQSITSFHQYVYVYLHSASEVAANIARVPLSLDVLKEIDKGTEALHNNRADDARKHWLKAAERAPENPDVQYLLGTLEFSQNNVAAAKSRFQRAIALSPTYEHALLALGELQLRDNQAAEATVTLQRALQVNTMSYRAEFYIAQAYLQQRDYANAGAHAQRAVDLGGSKQPMAHVLVGQALAAEGNYDAARHEFEALIHDYPNDPAATMAKEDLVNLEKSPTATLAVSTNLPVSAAAEKLPPGESLPEASWAPADVDTSQPGVASDVACPEAEIVQRTGQTSIEQLENFERFTASERIEHEDIDRNGNPGHLKTHDFSYLVFIDRDKSGQIFLKESRDDGGSNVNSFPTSLATVGLLSLGASIFHPGFAAALDFKCEGLGQWRGKAVWIVHFRQKANQRSYLRLWQTQRKTLEIPLKGRVWVTASTYEVVHVETDLREPVPDLELKRDHLVIDYGPVSFQNGKTELWLPWHAEMFLELHRKRYHHRHTLSNYSLFAVDTSDKINNPKGIDLDQQ